MAKILLVDDSLFTLKRHEKIVAGLGHETVTAGDGQKAIDLLENDSVDLVIMDLLMPVKDGVETLRELKESYPELNVAIVSADIQAERRKEVLDLGAIGLFNKPLDAEKASALLECAQL